MKKSGAVFDLPGKEAQITELEEKHHLRNYGTTPKKQKHCFKN
jgi:hypothetical protein